jgi:hypothetical protein
MIVIIIWSTLITLRGQTAEWSRRPEAQHRVYILCEFCVHYLYAGFVTSWCVAASAQQTSSFPSLEEGNGQRHRANHPWDQIKVQTWSFVCSATGYLCRRRSRCSPRADTSNLPYSYSHKFARNSNGVWGPLTGQYSLNAHWIFPGYSLDAH